MMTILMDRYYAAPIALQNESSAMRLHTPFTDIIYARIDVYINYAGRHGLYRSVKRTG